VLGGKGSYLKQTSDKKSTERLDAAALACAEQISASRAPNKYLKTKLTATHPNSKMSSTANPTLQINLELSSRLTIQS
jgi:hypothetical protein